MSSVCLCQTTYPKKIVIENDTLVLITTDQLYDINMLIVNNAECEELLTKEKKENSDKSNLIKTQDRIIENDKIIEANLIQQNKNLSTDIEIKAKQIKKLNRRLKFGIPFGVFSGFAAAVLIFK